MSLIFNDGYCGSYDINKYNDETIGRIGYCAGVFNVGASTAAYYNQEGPLKIYALGFGRAYIAYSAIKINKMKQNLESANKINSELASYATSAGSYFQSKPNDLAPMIDSCSKLLDPIFSYLVISGAKIDGDNLPSIASEMASNKRKDFGFK